MELKQIVNRLIDLAETTNYDISFQYYKWNNTLIVYIRNSEHKEIYHNRIDCSNIIERLDLTEALEVLI
jgi:hypothetical protein